MVKSMTMTNTTLTEDVSDSCQSSGPVGVNEPRQNIGFLYTWEGP